ncbi:LacI family DNA-binding transcriptional regulator [Roseomonas sp. OT10]|uniref:LacI family DNA-binding transcriptional regulator n=1 Tax=Roseomonas cutis TaxID=2897332 RepID=UPI001E46E51E|nr:LacI family DNA-binding transcriptional regulator [Roseomonas sp. OT10]UFN47198.1 LacI family DNA-binding transcriptional regulator [Roseomonas sp. OT10]
MADVARGAGVSKMTVSRALTGKGVSAETRTRILAVVERLGYVPDASAGTLSSGRSAFVSALVPTINNSNFAETARGLTDALAPAGLQLLLGYTEYRPDREEELVRAMLRHRPEALVMTGGDHTPATGAMLARAGLPVVETWDEPAEPIDQVIGVSNAGAAVAMVRHLVERGYRRIGYLGGELGLDRRGVERERGYMEALAALGLGAPRVIRHGIPPLAMEYGAEAVRRLVAQWPDTDAVFCVSDLHAFGVLMECHRQGWAVPGRLAVAGFGDFDVSRWSWPRITTVSVDAYGLGRQAGEALLAAREARRLGRRHAPVRVTAELAVLAREST